MKPIFRLTAWILFPGMLLLFRGEAALVKAQGAPGTALAGPESLSRAHLLSAPTPALPEQPLACPASIVYGDLIQCSIAAPGEMDTIPFPGVAGERVIFRLIRTSGSMTLRFEVKRPAGTTLCGPTTADELTCLLDADGTYSIQIRDNAGTGMGGYSLYLQRLNPPVDAIPIAYGQSLTGSIDQPAEMDFYTFSASAGEVMVVGLGDNGTSFDPQIRLYASDGSLVFWYYDSDDFIGVQYTIPADGAYTLAALDNGGTDTASYWLNLQRLNPPVNPSPIAYGQLVPGSIDQPAGADFYTFTASAGDVVLIGLGDNDASFAPQIRLYDSDGNLVLWYYNTGDYLEVRHTITAPDTYALVVLDNEGAAAASYWLYLQRLNNPLGCQALSYGATPRSGAISLAAEHDCFTLPGTPGSQVVLQAYETSGNLTIRQELLRPDGAPVCGPGTAELICTLDAQGTHALFIADNTGTATGNYAVYILCASGDCPTHPASPPAGNQRVYLPLAQNNRFAYFEGPWEMENNDTLSQANGPVLPGEDYYGYPDDERDYFFVRLLRPGALTVDLSNHVGTDVQFHIYEQASGQRVCYLESPPFHCVVAGNKGIYSILIYTASGFSLTAPYTLRASPDLSGYALSFDGSDDYISLPKGLIKALTTLTVEAWFKTTSSGAILGHQNQAAFGTPSNWTPILYVGGDGKLRGEFWNYKPTTPATSPNPVNDGQWHHVALVGDHNTQSLYLDGALIGSQAGDINHVDMSYNQVGSAYTRNWPGGNGGWFAFNGLIDEVRLWGVARSQAEIQADMNRSLSGNEAGLAAYWRFDDGQGDIAADSTGYANFGLLGTTNPAYRPAWVPSGAPIIHVWNGKEE